MIDNQEIVFKKVSTPNRGEKKIIKLSSDGESEQSLDLSLTPVNSLIEHHCVTEPETDLLIRECVGSKNLDQTNEDEDNEEELYSDCLEQFVEDFSSSSSINKNISNCNGNELLSTVIEEEDSLQEFINFEVECDNKAENKLGVKVNNETKQIECLKTDRNEILKEKNIQLNQHSQDISGGAFSNQEQVTTENFVKPITQGDQIVLTQSNICSATKNFLQEQCSKSIKSESPAFEIQQRVSVVKKNFESKVLTNPSNNFNMSLTKTKNDFCNKKEQKNEKICENINKFVSNNLEIDSKLQNNSSTESKKVLNEKLVETESKIAQEIREFKEREEELRMIRLDRMNKKNQSLEILTNSSNSCSSTNYLDSSTNSNVSSVTNDQYSASIDSLDEGFADYKTPNSSKSTLLIQSEIFSKNQPNNSCDLQKILATTRIQQEIEEQTCRELALKAIGSIKTISHERTDTKMKNNLLGSNLNITTSILSRTLSSSSLTSSLSSLNTNNNSNNNFADISSTSPSTKNCLFIKNKNLLKQRTFSTSHLNNLNTNQSSNNFFKTINSKQTGGRHISMQKFIATRGKTARTDCFSNQFITNGGHSDLSYSYVDLRPPKIDLETAKKKCLQSADFKIASELKEMQQREEELRNQRARLLGQSQPNLNFIDSDNKITNESNQDLTTEQTNQTCSKSDNNSTVKQFITPLTNNNKTIQSYSLQGCRAKGQLNLLKKATSNPNLTDAQLITSNFIDNNNEKKLFNKIGCKETNLDDRLLNALLKKRNPLIAKWEEKIMKK